jgi:hypothetical protein
MESYSETFHVSELYGRATALHGKSALPTTTLTSFGLDERGSIPAGDGGFFLYPLRPGDSGAQTASCTVGTGDLPRGKCGQGLLLTTQPF